MKTMKNEILDTLSKWTMNGKIDAHHCEDMATEIEARLAKNLHKPPVSGMFSLSEIQPLLDALKVIKNWNDEMEEEWEDAGYVADHALKKWNAK